MSARFLSLFLGFAIFSLIAGCGGAKEESAVSDNSPQKNEWTDSIFGKLSAEEQYYQHLIIEVPSIYQQTADSLRSWIIDKQPGGLQFIDWNPDSIAWIKQSLDTFNIIQPFIYTEYFTFLDIPQYPYWKANPKNKDPQLLSIFQKGRMNLLDLQYNVDLDPQTIAWLDSMKLHQELFPVIRHYDDEKIQEQYNDFLLHIQRFDHNVYLKLQRYDTVSFEKYRASSSFEGLFIAKTKSSSVNKLLEGGVDLIFHPIEKEDGWSAWKNGSSAFDQSTKRILDLKSQIHNELKEQHLSAELEYTQLNLIHNSASVLKDESGILPFKERFTVYSKNPLRLNTKVRKEVNISIRQSDFSKGEIKKIQKAKGNKVVFLHDSLSPAILSSFSKLKKKDNVLVCFSDIRQYERLKDTPNLMFIPAMKKHSAAIVVQQLSSRLKLDGAFVYQDAVYENKRLPKTLLARTIPEYCGYDTDTLSRINWAVKNAMNGRAFPGCQVLLAKNGCIIYDQQFGYHSYKRQKLVTDESIYDLASITKVVSTTLMGMKLWEMGKYDLQDSLYEYLPDTLRQYLDYPSTIRNITFHELFIHKSGLPAGFPLIRYLDYKTEDIGQYDKYYCDRSDTTYCIEVAKNFYLDREYADSMWLKLNQMWLDKTKPYKYSDVNMNTLYYMFKGMIDNDPKAFGFNEPKKKLKGRNLYTEYLYKTFYKPLGMERSRFKPLEKFDTLSVVPTENETFWRKQLLRGYVHDPNAALMGGIAGNAGMFSTTNDLVKLCQMWLDNGVYGGQRYLKAETIQKFTSVAENSHRGLGFNKRTISTTGYGMADSSSLSTYGHTGFTGTCFWIDPEEDLIYIFLSNRVHPKVNNRIYQFGIRKRIHNTAFEARLNY